jgi:hypothetical protein
MQADLDRGRKTTMRLWAKREEQIRGVVESTAGLYGDLQGIAGRSLVEIEGLELPLPDGPAGANLHAADFSPAAVRYGTTSTEGLPRAKWLFPRLSRSNCSRRTVRGSRPRFQTG